MSIILSITGQNTEAWRNIKYNRLEPNYVNAVIKNNETV